jgi:hypothetical protein
VLAASVELGSRLRESEASICRTWMREMASGMLPFSTWVAVSRFAQATVGFCQEAACEAAALAAHALKPWTDLEHPFFPPRVLWQRIPQRPVC